MNWGEAGFSTGKKVKVRDGAYTGPSEWDGINMRSDQRWWLSVQYVVFDE